MPSAPTINTVTDPGGYLLISYTNTGAGDHSQLWRMAPDENGGSFIKIADSLTWNTNTGYFRDYGAASGKTYTYQMVAVDGAGNTAASATKSGMLSLSSAWLHAIAIAIADVPETGLLLTEAGGDILLEDGGGILLQGSVTANAVLSLQLTDLAPHSRDYTLESVARVMANSALPVVGIGSIEKTQIGVPMLIPFGSGDNRSMLRSIYASPYFACLRDALGNKWFGRLLPFDERYGATFADIGLAFEILDFSEAVA